MSVVSPIPSDAPFVGSSLNRDTGKRTLTAFMSEDFNNWLLELTTRVDVSPERLSNAVSLTNQSTSLGVTAIPTPILSAGVYRVSTYMRITTVDAVSSGLSVTINFTSGGVACTVTGGALTTNLTTSVQMNTWLLKIDDASPVSYDTLYVSNTPAQMRYELVVVLENIDA